MTAEERSVITDLRQRGLGYKKISALTGIGINTVKAFCRRHGTECEAETGTSLIFCRGCGRPIETAPKQKPRQFCSDACRMRWWNSHPEQIRRKAYYSFTCPQCGRQFESYGNDHRKYCSRACAAASRRREGAPDES